jgi:hypothetical protein
MPFVQENINVSSVGPYTWRLNEALCYEGAFMKADGTVQSFTIPKDFRTDFASVPRILWALFPPYGAYTRATILHDWLLDERKAGRYHASSRDIDGLFKRTLKEYKTGTIKSNLMWTGVRWGAVRSGYRRDWEWWHDASKVLLISTIVLLLVVAVILGLHWIVDQLLELV